MKKILRGEEICLFLFRIEFLSLKIAQLFCVSVSLVRGKSERIERKFKTKSSLCHLCFFRGTRVRRYDEISTSLTEQTNLMSLVERSVDGQNFAIPAYDDAVKVTQTGFSAWVLTRYLFKTSN